MCSGARPLQAILLDRDGVLNFDGGYVCEPERFIWIPGAIEAVKAANDVGTLVIVITNQAGIGRGYYTEQDFESFMRWINAQLSEQGAHLDAWYYCPHHPVYARESFRIDCDCRKPRPGMVARAIEQWGLDPASCAMIGDKVSDLIAAASCGIRGKLFDPEHDNLLAAVNELQAT